MANVNVENDYASCNARNTALADLRCHDVDVQSRIQIRERIGHGNEVAIFDPLFPSAGAKMCFSFLGLQQHKEA